MAITSYYFAYNSLSRNIDATATAISSDYANQVQAAMEKLLLQLEGVAATQRLRTGDDQVIMTAMQTELKRIGQFEYLTFIAPDGFARRTNGTTDQLGFRDYFQKAMATKKPVVSDPLVSRGSGKLSINLAVPVIARGKVRGILVANYSLSHLNTMISAIKFGETGYGIMADDSGQVIADAHQPDLIGKLNLSEKSLKPEIKSDNRELDERLLSLFKQSAVANIQARGQFNFIDGKEYLAIATPITLTGNQRWVLLVSAPVAEATKDLRVLGFAMLAISAVSIILAIGFIVFTSARFAKPIIRIRDEAVLLADGDLRPRQIALSAGKDEIGQLMHSFQAMLEKLRTIVLKVQRNSEQVAAASQELTASSQQSSQAADQVAESIGKVATGSMKQLSAVNEGSAIAEEMSAAFQEIAASASEVASLAEQSVKATLAGKGSVDRAVAQINNVGQGSKTVSGAIGDLKESSDKIGDIVNFISQIAAQTNLLALNAAIEAARAGEHGRGFAVVADEVRKLAEQSGKAAMEITALIVRNSDNLGKAITVMEQGNRDVEQGVTLVTETGNVFADIAKHITLVSSQVREISTAVEETATGIQRLVAAMQAIEVCSKEGADEANTVSAATEEQLATMLEISSASVNLSTMAQELQQKVNKFRV